MYRVRQLVKSNKLFLISETITLAIVVGLSLLCSRHDSLSFWLIFCVLATSQTAIIWAWAWNRKWSQFYW